MPMPTLRSVKPLSAELIKAIEQTAKEQVQKLDEPDKTKIRHHRRAAVAVLSLANTSKLIANFAVRPIRMRPWCATAV